MKTVPVKNCSLDYVSKEINTFLYSKLAADEELKLTCSGERMMLRLLLSTIQLFLPNDL